MAGEIVTLVPNSGATLTVTTSPYHLGLDADWGDHVVEPALAGGPDVVGGIVGTRTRQTSEVTLPIRIKATTAAAYLAAAEELSRVAADLALGGGTITRQVDFGGGSYSEELEAEVLSCTIDTEDGWMQANRLSSVVTLTMTRNPIWLAAEETLATDATFTDSVKRLAYSAGGNLPGPARLVLTDNDSTARRFLEVGGAFEQDPQPVEYLAGDFTLGAASLVTGQSDAIGTEALRISSTVLPVWTHVGTLEGLSHHGSYRIRLRTKGGGDDAQFCSRVLWRSGAGQWKDLKGRVEVPDGTNYYDVDAGALYKYDSAETIDIRVDVKATAATTDDYYLNSLTITPTNHYSVSRGVPIEAPEAGASAFDDFLSLEFGRSLDDSDGGGTNRTAPAGGTWAEAGSGAAFEWSSGVSRDLVRKGANDTTTNIGTGYYAYLSDGTSATTYDDVEVVVEGSVNHKGDSGTQSILGAVARFSDANNWLMACIRHRRKSDGSYVGFFEVYKRVTTTITRLQQVAVSVHGPWTISLNVSAAGAYAASFDGPVPGVITRSGTDSDLASPSGAIDEGKVGMYSLVQSSSVYAYTSATSISGYGSATTSTFTDVIRDGGIGVLTHENSYSAATGGTDPLDFTPQGSRLWIPPGSGEITAKVRSSDSEVEPDTGYDLDTGVTLYHRRAYAHLSDALE